MKIRFLPRIDEYSRTYSVNGEVLTCTVSGQSDSVDLSELEHSDKLGRAEIVDGESVFLPGIETDLPCRWLVDAVRDESGTLWVTLYEQVPAGIKKRYGYSEWFDGLPTDLPERGFHSADLNRGETA